MPNESTTPDYTSIVDEAWAKRESVQAANAAREEAHEARRAKFNAENAVIADAQRQLNKLAEDARKADNDASKAIDDAFVEQVGENAANEYGVYSSGRRR